MFFRPELIETLFRPDEESPPNIPPMNSPRRREAILWMVCALLALGFFLLLTLNLAGIPLNGSKINYSHFGNWSEAVAGVATTTAVVVALAGLYWQRLSEQLAETKRLEGAEVAVFQWITSKEVHDDTGRMLGRVWDLRIHNSTDAPIYSWLVTFNGRSEHICSTSKKPLLPGDNVFNLRFLDNVEPNSAPEPKMLFEGRSGNIWVRSARGVVVGAEKCDLICSHVSRSDGETGNDS